MPLVIISARFAEEEKVLGWRAGNKKASLVVSVTVHVLVAFLLVVVLEPADRADGHPRGDAAFYAGSAPGH